MWRLEMASIGLLVPTKPKKLKGILPTSKQYVSRMDWRIAGTRSLLTVKTGKGTLMRCV
jgi:hypothetical protein